MKKNISISFSIKPVIHFFKRFHAIIFFLIVSACLFIAILLLLPITSLSTSESQTTSQPLVNSTFDQETINKLRNGSSSGSTYTPGERKSPFVE